MFQFHEKQFFAPWVYLLTGVSFIAGLVGCEYALFAEGEAWWAHVMVIGIFLLAGFATLNALSLETRLDQHELYVRLGIWIPFVWRHVPLNTIHQHRAVDYKPLREFGGWGWRFGKFEGEPCMIFNARGARGVLLDTNDRRIIIGSQHPEELDAAIAKARGESA